MVAIPKITADWLHFDMLDGPNSTHEVFSLCWRFKDIEDRWTRRVNSFKFSPGDPKVIRAASRVLKTALPPLFAAKGWSSRKTGLLAALSSSETVLSANNSVGLVAKKVAENMGLTWCGNLISKQPHKPLHSMNSAAAREEELAKADYKCANCPDGLNRILVLDDIATRGDTLAAIAAAVERRDDSVKIIGLSLGKSERQSYAAERGYTINNDLVPDAWAKIWDGA